MVLLRAVLLIFVQLSMPTKLGWMPVQMLLSSLCSSKKSARRCHRMIEKIRIRPAQCALIEKKALLQRHAWSYRSLYAACAMLSGASAISERCRTNQSSPLSKIDVHPLSPKLSAWHSSFDETQPSSTTLLTISLLTCQHTTTTT